MCLLSAFFCRSQAAAETAYDVVNPGSIVSPVKRGQHRLAQQPADLREGVTNAYQVVKDVSRVSFFRQTIQCIASLGN